MNRIDERLLDRGTTKQEARRVVEELRDLGHEVEYGHGPVGEEVAKDLEKAIAKARR